MLDVVAYVAIGVVAWVLGTATWLMLAGVGQRMVLDLRRDLFEHLTSLSLRYFSEQKAGWIIARLTSDVDALSDVLNQGLTTLVVNTLTLVAAIGGLFLLDWRLGLVALLVLPPGILITRWFQRSSHAAFADVRTRIAAVTAQLAESVAGMAVVQAFNRERAFQREFDELNEANRLSNVDAQKLSSVFFPAIELLGVIATVAVLVRRRADDRRRRARDRHADRRGRHALARLPAAAGALRALRPGAGGERGDGEDLARSSTPSSTSPTARARATLGGSRAASSSTASSFAYGEEPVMQRRSRSTCRRAAASRSSASPAAASRRPRSCIARFYDPDEGAVRVDGTDLRDVELALLPAPARRRAPGPVPVQRHDRRQHPLRAAGRDRRRGRGDAARAIGVDRVAARFADGLDHVVREGGAGLSAGERQLISIARALLADPRILILDEATSNIDRPTEVLIERAFDTLLAGRTSIDHRPPARDRPPRRRDPRARARRDRPARAATTS